MTKYNIDFLKPSEISYAELNPEENNVIVETAGFVPLEVKLKRFEQNGMLMQFNESEFTSSDLRTIYLKPDFEITPEDDMEEVMEKIKARNEFIISYKKLKTSDLRETKSEVAPQAVESDSSQQKKSDVKADSAADA